MAHGTCSWIWRPGHHMTRASKLDQIEMAYREEPRERYLQWIRHGAFVERRKLRSLTVILLMLSASCVSFAQESPGSLLAAGRYERALTMIEGALRSNPKDVRLWVAEGLAYRGLGRTR